MATTLGLAVTCALATMPSAWAMDYPPTGVEIHSTVTEATIPEPAEGERAQVCDEVWLQPEDSADMWWRNWGEKLWDLLIVTGTLHHAAAPGEQTLDLASVPVVADFELVFTHVGRENSQTVCREIGNGEFGAYGFTFTLDRDAQTAHATYILKASVTTPLWLPEETAIVRAKPQITTQASVVRDEYGNAVFTDQIWQTGWPEGHDTWAGQHPWIGDLPNVTVELWRIDQPDGQEGNIAPDACTEDNEAATLINYVQAPAANTRPEGITTEINVLGAADGTYTFVVNFSGDDRAEAFRTECGEAPETVTLTSEPPVGPVPPVDPEDPAPSVDPKPPVEPPGPSNPPSPVPSVPVNPPPPPSPGTPGNPVKQLTVTGTNSALLVASLAGIIGGVALLVARRKRHQGELHSQFLSPEICTRQRATIRKELRKCDH